MAEINFRKALIVDQSFLTFFTRPISLFIVLVLILVVIIPKVKRRFKSKKEINV